MTDKIFHLGIGIPSLDYWHADFATSVIGVVGDMKTQMLPGYDLSRVSTINIRSSTIAQQREDIVKTARKQECQYLLFVDSDQIFPHDTARRLIMHNKDVIGCNIAVKRLPSLPTARSYVEKWPYTGDIVYTTPTSKGIEQIWKIGCGVLLIKMEVFDRLTEPWFNFGWNDEVGYVGEDWWFCNKLWEAKIPMYIDHDLSREVGHIGNYIYTHKDVEYAERIVQIVRPDNGTKET
jgi:hypothetical protein